MKEILAMVLLNTAIAIIASLVGGVLVMWTWNGSITMMIPYAQPIGYWHGVYFLLLLCVARQFTAKVNKAM